MRRGRALARADAGHELGDEDADDASELAQVLPEGLDELLAPSFPSLPQADFGPGDVLIAHSVSGRNPVTVEVAMAARDAGAKVIALTNLAYSRSVTSRHPSGLRLFELADVVLDNHGEVGDAAVAIDGLDQRVSPTSTVVGAVMLNSIVAALVQRLVDDGMEHQPVFYSANLDGGDELKQRLVDEYRGCIHYRF